MKRKILSLILVLLLCSGLTLSVSAARNTNTEVEGIVDLADDKGEDLYLLDAADLLSDREEKGLEGILQEISTEYEAQIVVITIPSLEESDPDAFVEALYEELELGFGREKDGVLLLVCMDPREYRILTNGFAGDAIEEEQLEAIGDAFASDLSEGNYTEAFDTFAEECEYYLDGYLNGFPFDFGKNLVVSLGIGAALGLVVALTLKGQLKSVHKQNQANVYVKKDSMQVTLSNDMYLYRNVTRTKKESNKSSDSGSSRNVGGGSF